MCYSYLVFLPESYVRQPLNSHLICFRFSFILSLNSALKKVVPNKVKTHFKIKASCDRRLDPGSKTRWSTQSQARTWRPQGKSSTCWPRWGRRWAWSRQRTVSRSGLSTSPGILNTLHSNTFLILSPGRPLLTTTLALHSFHPLRRVPSLMMMIKQTTIAR